MKPLLVTVGDPDGIGPEVFVRAIRELPDRGPIRVLGALSAIRKAEQLVGALPSDVVCVDTAGSDEWAEVRAIREATEQCLSGEAAGIVTGPINKEKLMTSGFAFTGHTDFLGHLCDVDNPVMAFVGRTLNVALVTVHCPIIEVANRLTVPQIQHVIATTHAAFKKYGGGLNPRLLVCGLNPHAGDGGVLGREELETIGPAVKTSPIPNLIGPISAEAAFMEAMKGGNTVVVAMYHDQGLAPLKAVEFGKSVNWTLGLPILRTSVDHGTAYDLAWKGVADHGSALEAIRWARHCAAVDAS